MGRNAFYFLQASLITFLPKFNIYLVMNFMPVIPAGKCEANSHANAMNLIIIIAYLSERKE